MYIGFLLNSQSFAFNKRKKERDFDVVNTKTLLTYILEN